MSKCELILLFRYKSYLIFQLAAQEEGENSIQAHLHKLDFLEHEPM